MLGTNLFFVGRAAETISNEQQSIRIDPKNPFIWQRYRRIGQASLILVLQLSFSINLPTYLRI
jgi:hypothetical protein